MSSLESASQVHPEVQANENSARVVWALAWPAVTLNTLQIFNTLLDRFFIGRLPSSSLTAHGSSTSIMFLMFQLAVALATGSTALVSRAYGAGKRSEFRHAAQQSLRLAIIGGIAIAGLTALIAPMASKGLVPADNPDAARSMLWFLFAYSAGLPGIFVIQVLAGSLRGIGDTKSPMVISGIQIFIHMTLNFMLVLPHGKWQGLGLSGAGIALAASALVSAVIYIIYAASTPLGPLWSFRLPHLHWVQRIMRIAIPAATMACLRVLSLTAFTVVLTQIPDGSNSIAAMTTAFAIESIIIMPAFGLAAAAAALVGQSLGMKSPDRAARLGWTAAHHGALVTVIIAAVVFFAAPSIAWELLDGKQGIIVPAVLLIRMLCFTEIGFAYAMVLIGAMQGAGDTKEPMRISITSLWGLRVPMAIILAFPTGKVLLSLGPLAIALPFGAAMGAQGAWIALASTQGLQGILAALLFRRGRWKTTMV